MAINNSIALITKANDMLDEVYKKASVTAILDTPNDMVKFIGAKTAKMPKLSLDGLADYSRNGGYVDGNATLTYEEQTLDYDRGRKFVVDIMDDEETLGVAYGRLAGEFERTKVVPEADAYRFSKYYTGAANKVEADLTSSTALEAIDTAMETLENAEVDLNSVVLFVNPTIYKYIKNDDAFSRRFDVQSGNPTLNRNFITLDEIPVIRVPQGRFYTAINLLDGSSQGEEAGGFEVDATGKAINFMFVDRNAVLQILKRHVTQIISPEANNNSDGYIVKKRVYQGAGVYENKTAGVYVHSVLTNVVFTVTDGTDPIVGAKVTVNGEELTTDASGVASIKLATGDYDYTVTANTYTTIADEVSVAGTTTAEAVTMVLA